MNQEEFKKHAYQVVDWIAEYYKEIEKYPVKSNVSPREIFNKIPSFAPVNPEKFDEIFRDFVEIIIPGITHWQSPNFFAYFPANASFPSLLAEFLMSGLAVQNMKWETSPAATELEERVMLWLRDMIGLPENFTGVIQDTASTSTLAAILSARENLSGFEINNLGLFDFKKLRVYCSTEAHSSVEKAVKIAGIGRKNLVKIPVDDKFAMIPELMKQQIEKDIQTGYKPLCVVAALGTTGSTAVDSIKDTGAICKKYNIWLHIDAAFLGTALILPEFKWMLEGIENADSFVFNPHKWMFTNFDCSAYFVKSKEALVRTFEILPEYLKTLSDSKVNNYCDWGIPLGRRFRALKLWFVIRSFGVEGLQEKIREHISLGKYFANEIARDGKFEILAPVIANVICFRYKPPEIDDEEELNIINENLLHSLNRTGRLYLTHTKLNGKYTLRMVIAQTNVEKRNVEEALEIIKVESCKLKVIRRGE
jgi:aromatic-L-amino-acid decarboxylase